MTENNNLYELLMSHINTKGPFPGHFTVWIYPTYQHIANNRIGNCSYLVFPVALLWEFEHPVAEAAYVAEWGVLYIAEVLHAQQRPIASVVEWGLKNLEYL